MADRYVVELHRVTVERCRVTVTVGDEPETQQQAELYLFEGEVLRDLYKAACSVSGLEWETLPEKRPGRHRFCETDMPPDGTPTDFHYTETAEWVRDTG